MKKISQLFLVAIFLLSCNSSDTEKVAQEKGKPSIIVKGKLYPNGGLGYGMVYKMAIEKVLEGNLKEDTISIVVLAGDDNNQLFIDKHLSPTMVEISFLKKDENVEYSIMPLTGFVDKNKTSYEIVSIK